MKALLVSLVFSFPLACSNNDAVEAVTTEVPAEIVLDAKAESVSGSGVQDVSVANTDQKIIRQGSVRFETDDLLQTHGRILTAVKNQQGIITHDAEGKDYQSLYRNIVVRVPSNRFDALIAEVGQGVAYFDRKEISARDVTEEFIDVEARLGAKKKLETRYLEL